jgi:hypothetical protein
MSTRRAKFPWSDDQIRNAIGFHAIPDSVDEKIIRDLAQVGAKHIMDRRRGGRKPNNLTSRAAIRKLLVSIIFSDREFNLPTRLRKTPTSPPTLRKVCEILNQCGYRVSEMTVLKDVKELGSGNLREK